MNDIKDTIRDFLRREQISVVGFGELPATFEILEVQTRLPRTVTFGYRLSESVLATVQDRPTLLYKHHYKTVNWLLDQASCRLATLIEDRGFRALAIPASQVIDWSARRGHVSHRHLGVCAGLGYIGRSGLLINPGRGAQMRYASVLTDLPFEADAVIAGDCGSCMKCLAACPAQAIGEAGVDIEKCYKKLEEFVRIRGIGQHICGVCVKVCDGRN